MNRLFLMFFMGLAIFASQHASAHHSFSATFQVGEKITVEGTVTNFSFKNPHVLIYFSVENDDDTTTEWVSEGAAATNMRRAGWSADTFSAGEIVRVTGDKTHDGSPMTSIDTVDVLGVNGEIVRQLGDNPEEEIPAEGGMGGMGGPVENFVKAAPMDLTLEDDSPNLTGIWTRHGMGLGRPGRPAGTFNETGEKAQALFTEVVDPQVFCDAPGLMRQAGMTPHPVGITQFDDRVVFKWEEYGGSREVFFDDRDAKGYKTRLGDGVARYEKGALIIETTNLLPNPSSPEGQILSDKMTVTEIYTRADTDKFGPVLSIKVFGKDADWLQDELIFEGLKMSAGEYEFIENDCQTPLRERVAVNSSISFFITSVGIGDGANLGGLEGADAHCEALASKMNAGGKDWRAYLSTTGENGVNARDRIGQGPWYNARGIAIAINVDDLHSDSNNIAKQTAVAQNASIISGRGDEVNRHDILTGSQLDGTAMMSESDTTCGNWTSNAEEGSALVGHFDREGGGENPESWNQAHPSRGCSQENLQGTGGDGLFYCFASIADTTVIDVNNVIPVVGYVASEAQAAAPADVANAPEEVVAEVVEKETGMSSIIIAGLALLLLIVGVLVFRRKGS